jgi:hypothetical protein
MDVAKTARAKVSTDDLVRTALLKAAETGETKLTGKTDGLFASASGANKEAIELCRDAQKPLLAVVGKDGKAELVALAPAGFERIASDLPEDKVGAVAKRVATALPAAGRIEFIQDAIRRTPLAAPELTPLLEEAVATEKAESEARVAAAAKRRTAEEAAQKALERAMQLFAERQQNRRDALRREWEAEGGKADDLPPLEPHPRREAPAPTRGAGPEPKTAEDKDFRRDSADQFAATWLAAWNAKKLEAVEYLESAMWNVIGLKPREEVGAKVPFDGRYHQCEAPVFTNDLVKVLRPGLALSEDDQRDYVPLKAKVEKV